MTLTKQQREPHQQLVQVRSRVEACGYTRKQASGVVNELTDKQCDDVLSAKDDKAVESAISRLAPDVDSKTKQEQAERFRKQQEEIAAAAQRSAAPVAASAPTSN